MSEIMGGVFFFVWGMMFGISIGIITESKKPKQTNQLIIPELRININDEVIDTTYIYKFKNYDRIN